MRFLRVRAVVFGVLGLTARCLQRDVFRLKTLLGHELVFATLKSSVGGCGAASLFGVPRALVLASWKTLVVTWAFPGLTLGPSLRVRDCAAITTPTRYSILEAPEIDAIKCVTFLIQIEDCCSYVAKQKNSFHCYVYNIISMTYF